jgi:hypothetical protein
MARTELQYLENLQRIFDDEDFQEMVNRVKLQYFETWQAERKPENRERIYAQLKGLDVLVNTMRAAADSIAFDKKRAKHE